MPDIKMPNGVFEDKTMEEIPSNYLLWIAENWEEDTKVNKKICEAADDEWQDREKFNAHWYKNEK